MLFWERCHLNMPTVTEGSLVIASNSCGGVRAARLEFPHIENSPVGIHVGQGTTHRNCAKRSSMKTEEKRLWHLQGHKLCCSPMAYMQPAQPPFSTGYEGLCWSTQRVNISCIWLMPLLHGTVSAVSARPHQRGPQLPFYITGVSSVCLACTRWFTDTELLGLVADRGDLITKMSKEKSYSSLLEAKASSEFSRHSFCQETNREKYSWGLDTPVT